MDAAVIGALGVVGGAAVTALGAWVVARISSKPQVITADATVQAAINAGFQALTTQYERRNKELEEANGELNRKLDEALAMLDQQQGEIRDLTQHVESLENTLRRLGHDIPQRKRPHPMAKPPLAVIPEKPRNGR